MGTCGYGQEAAKTINEIKPSGAPDSIPFEGLAVIKEQKEIKNDIDETAQAILVTAMERMSSEVTADRTITALKLPDDDMKGRIIGKEGRNIQALQRATGVDIMVDDTPGMVVLSSFDPIRRQVARYA